MTKPLELRSYLLSFGFFLQKSDARECQETLANLPISVIGNFPDSRSPNEIIQEWARQSKWQKPLLGIYWYYISYFQANFRYRIAIVGLSRIQTQIVGVISSLTNLGWITLMCLTKCLKLGIVPLYCWRLWCLWFFMETSRPLFNIFLFQNWPRGGIRSYLKDNVKCDDCGVNVIAPDCLPCLIRLIHPTNKNYFLNLSLSKIDLGAVFNQPISSVVM